jgi:hypothetical protein
MFTLLQQIVEHLFNSLLCLQVFKCQLKVNPDLFSRNSSNQFIGHL